MIVDLQVVLERAKFRRDGLVRGEEARRLSIFITELEKLIAYFIVYVNDSEDSENG